jgi:O-antigen ligase
VPSIQRSSFLAATVAFVLLAALPLPHLVRDGAAIVALFFAAATGWSPRTALILLLVYLPFRVVVEAVTPSPVTFLPDVVVLALVVRVLLLHPDDILPLDAIEIAAILFGGWGLVASVHAHAHLGAAVLEVRDLLLFVVLYAAVRRLRRSGDGIDDAWWSRLVPYALAAIAVVGVQGMLQTFVVGHAFLLPGKLAATQANVVGVNAGRPYGWLDNPNVFGELGFLALVVAYDHFRSRAFRPGWLAGVTFAFFAAMVVLSFSRSAYIAVLVAAAIFIYAARGRERALIGVAVVAMALAVALMPGARARAVFGQAPNATTATSQTANKTPKSTSTCTSYVCLSNKAGRLHNLKVALKLIRHHPFGTGLGTFGSAGALAFHVHVAGLPKNFYADNQYTVVLVETGAPGALLFALLGVATFLAILRMRSRSGGQDRRLLLSLFIAMVILGATSNAWEQLVLTLYPWLALAALLPAHQERQRDVASQQGGRLKMASAGP